MYRIAILSTLFLLASVSQAKEKIRSVSIQVDDAPELLDWGGQVRLNEASYIVNLMEGLFRLTKDGYEPAVAKRFEVSKDQKQYTFYLNPKVKWSDGRPVYAQDFVYAWLRVLSPQSTSLYFSYFYDIQNAENFHLGKVSASDVGVRADGDFKLIVNLRHPVKSWEKNVTFWPTYPARKDQIEKYGTKFSRAGILVSNGPFVFDSADTHSVVFKKNPYYLTASQLVPEIHFILGISSGDRCKAYQEGRYQILLFPFGCDRNAVRVPLQKIDLLIANTTKFPANERRFREAVFASIDMDEVLDKVPGQVPARSLFSQGLVVDAPAKLKYDPKWAKEELKSSGIRLNSKSKITILTYQTEPHETVAKRIKQQIEKNLGLNVELMSLANREYLFYSGLNDYHFMLMAWTAKVLTPADSLQPFGNAGKNRLNYSSPVFDMLVQDGLYSQAAQKLVEEDAVVRPAFFEVLDVLIHPDIKGLYFDHMGLPYFRQTVLK